MDNQTAHMQVEEESKIEVDASWSNINIDMLWKIFKKLSLIDQIRFGAVCKTWSESAPSTTDKLALLFRFSSMLDCDLLDPFSNQNNNHTIHTINNHILLQDTTNQLFHGECPEVHDSGKGWLLGSYDRREESFIYKQLFIYNPFKKKIILLPKLDSIMYIMIGCPIISVGRVTISVSGTKTSLDITVFFIHNNPSNGRFHIQTCKPGDAIWTSYYYHCNAGDIYCCDAVSCNGQLYCLINHFRIVSFNNELKTWSTITYTPKVFHGAPTEQEISFLVPTEAEVWLIFVDVYDIYYQPESARFNVFKFDGFKREWRKENDLGNRIICLHRLENFQSHQPSLSVLAEGETATLANRIYYFAEDSSCWFFSFETGKSELSFQHDEEHLNVTWIEPPSE